MKTRSLTIAAAVAAAYAALTLLGDSFGLTFGPVQCRFAEALCVLPFLLPESAWGLAVGCFAADLFSPYGLLDMIVGPLITLCAALLTARCRRKWLAPLPPVVLNAVCIGALTAWEQTGGSSAFAAAWGWNTLTVAAGEAIACYGLGALLLWRLPMLPNFRDLQR